jgi:PPE-repeat protein
MTRADELEALARRLEAVAASVGTALDPVVAHHRPDVWQGTRAARFGQELIDQRAWLRAAADQLTVDARLLQARAALLRVTQALTP